MNRPQHAGVPHAAAALVHRGPQAITAPHAPHSTPLHAPNAALLIDFDNVTMGIRSDLATELRNLLSSDIIRGKVAVQRAYADWRRYPNYVVTLAESSIDMIMAPAYGSSKKNATDIRLAIDALELVFTRPEIGTFILLSGDSDFSSLVIKLKEYGKYVIGVGIRESSSDLLVMNCDEYYSWSALTGLVRAAEEEPQRKWDPWELVTEAVQRMKRNGDVMRSDRLKQVMQELDSSFDEKNLGMAKFSRFVQEAAHRGLLSVTKLDNGQLEIDTPTAAAAEPRRAPVEQEPEAPAGDRAAAGSGRRARRGRGRDRDRGRGRDRDSRPAIEPIAVVGATVASNGASAGASAERAGATPQLELTPETSGAVGASGERLTRDEAFDLVRRAVESLTTADDAVRAGDVRRRARELLGRDSESLSERNFGRILRDAHDGDVIDLRRRGDDFEVARAIPQPAADAQLQRSAAPVATPSAPSPGLPGPRMGVGPRGTGPRGRAGRMGPPPPELLSVGVVPVSIAVPPVSAPVSSAPVETPSVTSPEPAIDVEPSAEPEVKRGTRAAARRGRGRKQASKRAASRATPTESSPPERPAEPPITAPIPEETPSARRAGRVKSAAKSRRSRKPAPRGGEE